MPLHCGRMSTSRRRSPLLGASMLFVSACFGEYAPATDPPQGTDVSTTAATTSTTSGGSTESSSSSTGEAPLCDHVDIVILTDVSISMAPFANGILNVILAMGTMIDATLADFGTYRLALAFNAPPLVNEGAFSLPQDGKQCTQLGALVRGQDACVEEFDSRPYLTEADDLGPALTCLAQGVISGGLNAAYERPQIFDTLLAILEVDDDPTLAACNEGFHQAPDPLVVIVIADADDQSDATVLDAVTRALASQGGESLENVGVFVIGADGSGCPSDTPNACGALPACRVQEFADRGFSNVGLPDNVRRFNICRSLEENSADVAAALLAQLSAVLVSVCGD